MTRRVMDEVVLLDMATEGYFGLTPTSAVVFETLRAGNDLDDAVQAILDGFEVDEPEARADVFEVAQTLVDLGFLSPVDGAAGESD